MKETRLRMGMPVTIEVVDDEVTQHALDEVFEYFRHVDEKFSTYKETSEITAINNGKLPEADWSDEMRLIFALAEKTKRETDGYFDIKKPDGTYDPSGLVKGLVIRNAARMLDERGFKNFYVDAGGDMETRGKNRNGKPWSVGIRNPWNKQEIVQVVYLENKGMATSGIYERGTHIYNPKEHGRNVDEIISLTVIGSDVYEADRIATAAFAMGEDGIAYLERTEGLEGYSIDGRKQATFTSGFKQYTHELH